MPIIIVSIIAVLAIIIALCFIFTTDENKTPEEIFQECIDNIDNIESSVRKLEEIIILHSMGIIKDFGIATARQLMSSFLTSGTNLRKEYELSSRYM